MHIITDYPQALGLLVGFLLPLATSIVQRPTLSRPVRVLVAVAMAVLAGTAATLAVGGFDPGNWLTTIGAVLVAAQSSYESLWQPSGVTQAIENATSPAPAAPAVSANSAAAAPAATAVSADSAAVAAAATPPVEDTPAA